MSTVENHLMYTFNQSQNYNSFECRLAGGVVFEFTRYDNLTRFVDDPNVTSRYIINCNIKNNIGVVIYSFKMNEAETLNFIDCVANFLYYFTDTGSYYIISLLNSNSNYHYPTFKFINTSRFICEEDMVQKNIFFNDDTGEYRYFDLVIYDSFNKLEENQMLKLPMSPSEIEDLMFQICLTVNIDFGTWLNENFDDSDIFMY